MEEQLTADRTVQYPRTHISVVSPMDTGIGRGKGGGPMHLLLVMDCVESWMPNMDTQKLNRASGRLTCLLNYYGQYSEHTVDVS